MDAIPPQQDARDINQDPADPLRAVATIHQDRSRNAQYDVAGIEEGMGTFYFSQDIINQHDTYHDTTGPVEDGDDIETTRFNRAVIDRVLGPGIHTEELERYIQQPVQRRVSIERTLIGHQAVERTVDQTPGEVRDLPLSDQDDTDYPREGREDLPPGGTPLDAQHYHQYAADGNEEPAPKTNGPEFTHDVNRVERIAQPFPCNSYNAHV